jgi:hypothetical protein
MDGELDDSQKRNKSYIEEISHLNVMISELKIQAMGR